MPRDTRDDAAGFVVRREVPAKVRHVAVQDLVRAGRGALPPQVVHEAVERNDLVRMQQQHGEERALPSARQRVQPTAAQDLQRPQDSKLHLTAGSQFDGIHS